ATGGFILIDEHTNATVGAGMVLAADPRPTGPAASAASRPSRRGGRKTRNASARSPQVIVCSPVSEFRLVFVGGIGRSGSTLIERLLGELPGVCSMGEVVHMWRRALVDDET